MAKNDNVFDVWGAATPGVSTYDNVFAVSGSVVADLLLGVTLGPDVGGLEPYSIVTITATLTNGAGAVLAIEQYLGPTVLLIGSGPTWTYDASTEPDLDGAHLSFRVTATVGAVVASAEVQHFVYPSTFAWANELGQLLPARVTT